MKKVSDLKKVDGVLVTEFQLTPEECKFIKVACERMRNDFGLSATSSSVIDCLSLIV